VHRVFEGFSKRGVEAVGQFGGSYLSKPGHSAPPETHTQHPAPDCGAYPEEVQYRYQLT
jgi:hypothetical protein